MRKSLLVGLFLSALFFVASSAKTEATSIDLLEINNTKPVMEQLLAAADNVEPLLAEEPTAAPATVESEKIEHKVAENETLSKIAEKYETTWKRIYDKNDNIETPDVINPGEVILIPDAEEVLEDRSVPIPEPVAQPERQVASTSATTAQAPVQTYSAPQGSSSGNRYTAGYCTWYVKSRRPDLPNNLGNAYSWISRAASQGIATGSTPRAGAVAQRNNHVAYVESVNSDGTITISDMNYRALYAKTVRVVNPSEWRFIY